MKPEHACYYLGNKAYFFPPPAENRADDPAGPTTPFWCLRTHDATGPDGKHVDDVCCGPDRRCYQPEVQL